MCTTCPYIHRQRKKVERKVEYRGVRGVLVEIPLKIIGITSDFSQNLKWQIRYNLVPIPRWRGYSHIGFHESLPEPPRDAKLRIGAIWVYFCTNNPEWVPPIQSWTPPRYTKIPLDMSSGEIPLKVVTVLIDCTFLSRVHDISTERNPPI